MFSSDRYSQVLKLTLRDVVVSAEKVVKIVKVDVPVINLLYPIPECINDNFHAVPALESTIYEK